jgi:dephospho-CoA kinase
MMTLGVTGGIGMGKSTVAEILARRGLAVVDTDDLARQVVRPGEPALEQIRSEFGPTVIDVSNELNREALAGVIFRDEAARKKLEAILHPRIQQLWQGQLAVWKSEGRAQVAVIIPLLFETGAESEFDTVLCIACSPVTQRQRLNSRGWTSEQIEQRISAQMPIAEKMSRAHRVVWNEGDLAVLARQCDRILSTAL